MAEISDMDEYYDDIFMDDDFFDEDDDDFEEPEPVKYTNLWHLVQDMAREAASAPESATVYHLLYAYAHILTMPRHELLSRFDVDKDQKLRILACLATVEENRIRKPNPNLNLDTLDKVVPLYLPAVERAINPTNLCSDYNILLKILTSCYHYTCQIDLSRRDADEENNQIFAYVAGIIFSPDAYEEVYENIGYDRTYDYNTVKAHTIFRESYDKKDLEVIRRSCKGIQQFFDVMYCKSPNLDLPDISKESQDEELFAGIEKLEHNLRSQIFGQYHAITKFVNALSKASMFVSHKDKPLAVFLLAGPPGVGKTMLANITSSSLIRPHKRFDMSEYSGGENVAEGLIGFERTWKNSQPGLLTSYVEKHPYAILLFDEIEKAAPAVLRLFLQIISGARLTDKFTDRTVSFENTILIFTTNAGKELYEDNKEENLSLLPDEAVITALQNDPHFPNELVSRFASNNIIIFNHVTKQYLCDVAFSAMNRAKDNIRKSAGEIEIDESLAHLLLLHEGDNVDARVIESKAADLISDSMLKYRRALNEENEKGEDEWPDYYYYDPDADSWYDSKNDVWFDAFEDYTPDSGQYRIRNTDSSKIVFEIADEKNAASDYIIPRKENPVRIIYFSGRLNNETKDGIKDFLPDWINLEFVPTGKRLLDAIEKTTYEMIVIDPKAAPVKGAGDDDSVLCLNMHTEGNECLNTLLNEKRKNIYVIDNGLIPEEKEHILRRGVKDILPVIQYGRDTKLTLSQDYYNETHLKPWIKTARINYIMRSQEKLSYNNSVINFQVIPEIPGKIRLCMLSVQKAAVTDASTRRADKNTFVSSFERPKERFSDIIGAKNAVRELEQFIKFIKNFEYYESLGVDIPRGLLLYGPPGTGKTMLAKAAAGESGVSFIAVGASDFFQPYIGTGENMLREKFDAARRNSPAIIFIDEIDSFGKKRTGNDSGTNSSARVILETLLKEMDGFSSLRKKRVFVMAATNSAINPDGAREDVVLDPALVRRFRSKICVDLPTPEERVEYAVKYFKKKREKTRIMNLTDEEIDSLAQIIAEQTTRESLAEVENLLDGAYQQFILGLDEKDEKSKNAKFTEEFLITSIQEARFGEVKNDADISVAYHEAGHALMMKIAGRIPGFLTIVSRDDFGGYVHPKEVKVTTVTEQDRRDSIKISLAGRVGEMIYYKYFAHKGRKSKTEDAGKAINTGAGSDLANATWYAEQILTKLGRTNDNLAVYPQFETPDPMDKEHFKAVNLLLEEEMEKTIRLIEENRKYLNILAKEAFAKKQLTEKQMCELLKDVPVINI